MRTIRLATLSAAVTAAAVVAPLTPAQADDGGLRPVTQSHWAPGADESLFELTCAYSDPKVASATLVEDSAKGFLFTVVIPNGQGGAVEQTMPSDVPFVDGWTVTARQQLKDAVQVDLRGGVRISDWPETVYEPVDGTHTEERFGWSAPVDGRVDVLVTRKSTGRGPAVKRHYPMTCRGSALSLTVRRSASAPSDII